MNCHELAERVEQIHPHAMPRDVARLCLLLSNYAANLDSLEDEATLTQAWQEMGIRLQAASDQHAAMTEELEILSQGDAGHFTADQIGILIRAIRVQSQVLQLYVGRP